MPTLQGFDVAGTLTEVTATNSLGINSTIIACIPCDDSSADYPGELGVDQTVQGVITAAHPAAAIILYSASATHCNLTTNDQTEAYRYIFTFTQPNAFAALNQTLVTTCNAMIPLDPHNEISMDVAIFLNGWAWTIYIRHCESGREPWVR